MGLLVKKLGAGAITIALVGCGGGSESDAKISSPESKVSAKSLSGVVMDGYLKNANVCLDKNSNSVCDSADGAIVLTDESGHYELPFEGDVSSYNLLVEALSGVTEDMDNPGQVLLSDFTLEAPATRPEIISPLTSMVSSIAQTTGVSFDDVAKSLASDLNVSEQTITSDYVGSSNNESQQIHMLARGITKVLQSAQESSVSGGVTEEHARKGSMQRLANLDVAALKQRTDNLSHGAKNTDQALAQIAGDYKNDLKITPDDIKGDKVLSRPNAPKNPAVNDAADTFDWHWAKPFNAISDYEFSLDGGMNWQSVTQKPINVGSGAIPQGNVQVRVAAKPERSIATGSVLVSDKAYTDTLVAPAPTALNLNDANNELDWTWATGFSSFQDYEYSVDSGNHWKPVTVKPQYVGDIAVAAGELKLRVKADGAQGRPAGLMAKSTQPLTVTPPKPTAPVVLRADDATDILEITLVQGFPNLSDYEINLGSGWNELATNPVQIGNVDIASNTIQVRVKANATNGRPAGSALVVTQPFTRATNKPSSPTLPVVDNANNQFGWTNVSGFADVSDYELSTDGGKSFSDVSNNPHDLSDSNFSIGDVCVRVKQTASNATGSLLCNDKPYSVTPVKPPAPNHGVVDDALNTFDWNWVSGFETIQDYEVRIEAGEWQPVQAKPVQLEDRAYAIGTIEVRVKHNPVDGRDAGEVLSNTDELTKQPDAPVAPTSLVVDDTANTLDWVNVAGFTAVADYEWSANSGSTWTQAVAKPIVVGDIAKRAGEVQIRVRANGQNGRLAGAAALTAQAYTQTPTLPAPSNGAIKVANNGVVPNMISWDYVNSGEYYDRAEYYEFTVDKGTTWHAVTNNPQFVGPKAYDKSDVGIRVKQNAIAGKENGVGSILWASALTGQFGAFEYVPMETWNQSSGFSLYHGWNGYDTKCIAQYNSNGEGEPTFWAVTSVSRSEDVFTRVSELTTCGINHWQLPKAAEALTLTTRSIDTLPSYAKYYLISNDSIAWLDEAGTAIAYINGVKTDAPSYSNVVVKWQLASGTELVADINSKLPTLDSFLYQQSTELTQATSFLTTWLATNQAKQKSYTALSSEANVKLSALNGLTASWEAQKAQQQELVSKLAFEAKIAQSRTDSESAAFIVKVAEFENKFEQLSKNNVALVGAIEATEFAEKLANIQSHSQSMTSAQATLLAANSGSAIHQATLAFYAALFDIESDYDTTDALKAALNNALNGIDNQFVALISAMTDLVTELDSTIAVHNADTLHTTAEDGLNRAHSAGFVVAQSDALIDGQFAKLDSLGRYLPKATSYQQGWRCVLDTNVLGTKRVWTLLSSGLPGSKDEVVYNAAGADLPSVVGAGGVLETANNDNLCGFNDWKMPHPNQIKSLETATVAGLNSASKTIDVNVFPNHKGLVPEYDKSYYSGGTRFYYWTSAASSSSKQYAYVFANTSERPGLRAFDLDGDSYDQYVTMARLMREDSAAWDYIASDGSIVADRASAQCAKHPTTGEVWQLFHNATPSERYKTFNNIQTELANYQGGMCGKSNWGLPSVDDVRSLIPTDAAVFPYAAPTSSDYSDYDYYVTNGTTGTSLEYVEIELGESNTRYNGSTSQSKFLYRFVAK
ncbi:DUF1566 domain-containing protein [Vibrio ouci]|uniref:DUF1566 domain-containing protein n=1 Tax=Vibrio ouci TaxID=2499078 RepID=A0A4Y8WLU0_9VIBR|nr:DUF1566 domain-containing protein [Vibrio ouci]TFH93238.1 DUF1566 domain-containing protein [Vibrio ouci]